MPQHRPQRCFEAAIGLRNAGHTPRPGPKSEAACRHMGASYGADGQAGDREAVTAAQLPALAQQSFPLCMGHMYGHVRSAHHLHHQGRLQLGLFLKVPPEAWQLSVWIWGPSHTGLRLS